MIFARIGWKRTLSVVATVMSMMAGGHKHDGMQLKPTKPLVFSYPVTNPGLGQNDMRIIRVFFDLLPKLADIYSKILRIFRVRRSPNRCKNLHVSDHAAGVAGEKR